MAIFAQTIRRLKKALAILMITAILLPNLTKVGILIEFTIHQDFIAEVLCINRDKPASTCEGKCYLSQKMKKAEEQDKKPIPTNFQERLQVVYYDVRHAFDFWSRPVLVDRKLALTPQAQFYSSSYIADIFHPPKSSFDLI